MTIPLHALIAQWREQADEITDSRLAARLLALRECADELEALLASSALRDEEGQQKIGESLGMSGNILVEGWNTGRPPDRVLVEVEVIGPERTTIERVRAVWGSVPNGVRPHWESEDGDTLWSADAFSRWRPVVASGVTK